MDINCYYSNAIKESENLCKINKDNYVLTGLAANIDYITHFKKEDIKGKCKDTGFIQGSMINNQEDFYGALYSHISTGKGGELFVTDKKVCEWIKNEFSWGLKIGGTGAQIANALSMLDKKVLLHSTSMSQELKKLLCGDNIFLVNDKKIVELDRCIYSKKPYEHFIFEYDESVIVGEKGKEIRCPRANRLILYLVENLELNKEFFESALENAMNIRIIALSGLNIISNKSELKQKLNYLVEFIKKMKEINNDIFVYFENGDTKNKEIKEIIFYTMLEVADSIGMNENEFEDLLVDLDISVDTKDVNDLLEKALFIHQKLHFKEMIIHAESFAIGITNKDPIKLRNSLLMGNLVSCNRARTGSFGSYEDIKECLETIPINMEGYNQIKELIKNGIVDEDLICRINSEKSIAVVPSRKVLKPVCTVGLGDSFVAGLLSLK